MTIKAGGGGDDDAVVQGDEDFAPRGRREARQGRRVGRGADEGVADERHDEGAHRDLKKREERGQGGGRGVGARAPRRRDPLSLPPRPLSSPQRSLSAGTRTPPPPPTPPPAARGGRRRGPGARASACRPGAGGARDWRHRRPPRRRPQSPPGDERPGARAGAGGRARAPARGGCRRAAAQRARRRAPRAPASGRGRGGGLRMRAGAAEGVAAARAARRGGRRSERAMCGRLSSARHTPRAAPPPFGAPRCASACARCSRGACPPRSVGPRAHARPLHAALGAARRGHGRRTHECACGAGREEHGRAARPRRRPTACPRPPPGPAPRRCANRTGHAMDGPSSFLPVAYVCLPSLRRRRRRPQSLPPDDARLSRPGRHLPHRPVEGEPP